MARFLKNLRNETASLDYERRVKRFQNKCKISGPTRN